MIFLYLDTHLKAITNEYGLLTYLLLFATVFSETDLVVTSFLLGDSLIFATGTLAASGSLNLFTILFILCLAAGDTVNYHIGRLLRSKIVNYEDIRFVKKKHLDSTHIFCEKYGIKTIILVRFIPIIRTFAPFVAGMGIMPYSKFICYSVIGGIEWVSTFFLGGYFLEICQM